MTRWVYKQIVDESADHLGAELDKLGAEGWELVSVCSQTTQTVPVSGVGPKNLYTSVLVAWLKKPKETGGWADNRESLNEILRDSGLPELTGGGTK